MDGIYKKYLGFFSKEANRTGIELEFPVTSKKTSEQPSIGEVASFLLRVAEKDPCWKPKFDELIVKGRRTSEYCTSIVRSNECFAEELSTDMAIGTMELALRPAKTLRENEERLRKAFDLIIDAAEKEGLDILGLGIQPFQKRNLDNMMPKERYLLGAECVGESLSNMTITSAAQVHLDVPKSEAISVLNAFLGFSPAIVALTANSTILEGRLSGVQEFRGVAWDSTVSQNILEKQRVGIPDRFGSMEDWFGRIVKLRPLLIERDGKYLLIDSDRPSFEGFMAAGMSYGRAVNGGGTVPVFPEFKDFITLLGTNWTDARFTGYGTIELRTPSFQPSASDLMSINALALGLSINHKDANRYLSFFTDDDIRTARIDSIKNGLGSSVSGLPMRDVADKLLCLSEEGLSSEDRKYLAPLWHNLEENKNPAVRSVGIFADLEATHRIDTESFRRALVDALRFSID